MISKNDTTASNSDNSTDSLAPQKLSVFAKLSWGVGAIVDVYMINAMSYLALPIYNIALGVDPRMLSWAMGIPRFLDAIADPIIGNISDNTRTRWGRRRPYIAIGAILCGIMFALMWMPPTSLSPNGLAIFFLLVGILYYAGYSIFGIPWTALGYELSTDYNERTRIMAYRTFITALGGLGLGTLWWLSLRIGKNEVEGVRVVGILVGVLIIIVGLMPALFCREAASGQCQKMISLKAGLKSTFRNKPFLQISTIVFLILIGIFIVQPLSLYINIYYVYGGDKEAVSTLNLFCNFGFQGIGLVLTPLVAFMGTHLGKKKTLLIGLGTVAISFPLSWFFYTPACPYLQLICLGMASVGLSCVWVLSGAMIADVCDIDELATGLRREGMYGAVFAWVCKVGVAAVMILSGYMLNWSGYDAQFQMQTPQTVFLLRFLYAAVPPMFLIVAIIITALYPVDEKRVRETRAILDQRKQAAAIQCIE
ncbi:MAG: MFS transporter [Phycisphaerae bacterium]|jgi:GPH family glycoside/pentoside/hexuronide:cation symporter